MDKYHGVYVKIILSSNDTVKGHIYGKDESGNLILKNATTESANGYKSNEDMLPIITTLIKDLEVLDMKSEEAQQSTPQPPQPTQSQPQPNQQQIYMQQQEQLKQQEEQFKQQQQQMFSQQQQQFQQMQQQHAFPQQPFHPMHQYHSPMQQFQPSPHASHVDPAILFQHSMNQANIPLMPRDPAIISSQQQSYDGAQKNDKSSMNMNSIDPAILFTQSAGTRQQHNQQQAQQSSNSTTPNIVQNMFQQHQQSQPQQEQQKKQQHQQKSQRQKQDAPSTLKSLDPSILFQQASKPKAETSSPSVPFQDPAIISVTNTPEIKDNKPNKPLFGGKKVKKAAKEVVVYEDYSDFESGKTGVKKTQPTKKTDEMNTSSSNSNASTPTIKKKNKEDQKPSAFTEVLPTKPTKQSKATKTPPIEILSKQSNSSSSVPTSLIPPKARRSNSSTPQLPQLPQQQQQQQFSKNNTAIESARILTVSGGIQIPTVTSGQMENVKNVARETGLTQAQLVENGAFGISLMVLKAIGGHRRIQPDNHNAAPVIVILAGPTSIGEFGIAAARHLANRGCQVIVSVTNDSYCGATVEQYKALAKFSGARIVSSIDELPNQYTTPVDLIVDTLLGSEIKSMSPAIKSQMNWANANKAPVLSIDFPSGVHPDSGSFPNNNSNYITPKWTLCLGAPYTGCTSRSVTGELFLADSGLPFVCFQSVVRNFHVPWGSDFVLALEYA